MVELLIVGILFIGSMAMFLFLILRDSLRKGLK